MSRVSQIMHIVINTKSRRMVIPEAACRKLYAVVVGLMKEKRCFVYRVNGIGNHLHLLVDIHATVRLDELVRHLKQNSSLWMRRSGLFPDFECWGREYFAVSVSPTARESVMRYISNQKSHHLCKPFEEELKEIISLANMEWDDRLLT